MYRSILYTLLIVSLFSTKVLGSNFSKTEQDSLKRKWYIPHDAKIQYAGNIGFLSAGVSYHIVKDLYRLSLMYGNTSSHSDAKSLNTFAFKNTFLLKKFQFEDFTIIPTAGLSINLGSTHNTFRRLPDYFPDGYYFQNKIHFAPFFGTIIYHPLPYKGIKGIDFYAEIGTMDNYLLECIRTDYVKLGDIWNLGLGFTFYF
jgi:hypothetical protein